MIPVAFNVREYNTGKDGRILLNGEPVRKCFNCNEAEGWVDVWVQDENGKTVRAGHNIAHERLYGTVYVEMDTPAQRAYIERAFPASQMELERRILSMTTAFVQARRNATGAKRQEYEQGFLAAIADAIASDEPLVEDLAQSDGFTYHGQPLSAGMFR